MGDLHSIAYTGSLGWDLHNLEVLNADLPLAMDGTCASFFSGFDSDPSSGYLEDALVEFSEQSKRRRLMNEDDLVKMYENSNMKWDMSENYDCINQATFSNQVSDRPKSSLSFSSEEENMMTEMKTPEALDYSSSSSYKDSADTNPIPEKRTAIGTHPMRSSDGDEMRKKRAIKRVVYPFALVKPGGTEGDVTLNDINERILMRPTRPVRHPVGDFACRPCLSADGTGISGKAVVALTRIQTQGRGTITIIRTKG